MLNILIIVAGLSQALAAAISPRSVNCDFATLPAAGDTCATLAAGWGLSDNEFQKLNPGVTCPNLDLSKEYCVMGTVTEEPASTTTVGVSSSTLPLSTTLSTSIITQTSTTTTTATLPSNTPAMPGLAPNCDGFHKVSSGDQCDTIATKYGITVAQFKAWNSEINTSCSNLWLDYYVCVHVPGTPTATQPGTTTTTAGNGVQTPQPTQPGMIANCNKFHLVTSSTSSCQSIITANSITMANFYKWNTGIDPNCSNLWLNAYVCIGVTGGTPPSPTSTTSAAPGTVATPAPIQPGMVSNCNRFHLVNSSTTCQNILSSNGITMANFLAWNTGVNSSCSNLWLGYYVCTRIKT